MVSMSCCIGNAGICVINTIQVQGVTKTCAQNFTVLLTSSPSDNNEGKGQRYWSVSTSTSCVLLVSSPA